jgi:hypothetical protein
MCWWYGDREGCCSGTRCGYRQRQEIVFLSRAGSYSKGMVSWRDPDVIEGFSFTSHPSRITHAYDAFRIYSARTEERPGNALGFRSRAGATVDSIEP